MAEEGFKFPRGFASKFSAYCSNAQIVPTAAWTTIQMGSFVLFDTLGELSAVTHMFTPLQTGYYMFHASIAFQNLNVGDEVAVRIWRNAVVEAEAIREHTLAGTTPAQTMRFMYVVPTDTIYVQGWHNFGANRTVFNGVAFTRFEGFRVA